MVDQSFAEDSLPDGQLPIETTNILRFNTFMELMHVNERQYPTIGIVTGRSGIGKTIATQVHCETQALQMHTGLPSVIKVKVRPGTTAKTFALDVVAALRDKPRGRNVYEVADEAAAAIIRNDLQAMIVDEGDRLNEKSFEVLRHIHDRTGCPVVVVGLPSILSIIDRDEKFASRIGLRMEFLPLGLTEVLEVVLPQLVFQQWVFDPTVEEHHELGAYIWQLVNPSLRKLRSLLQAASKVAEHDNSPQITKMHIQEAFKWTASATDKRRASANKDSDQGDSLEADSERRQAAKQKKNNRDK